MASLFSTTTGLDTCRHVIRVVEKFKLITAILCGLTTDGTTSMTGMISCLKKKIMDAVGVQNAVARHCIIHQEDICAKVLAFAEAIKNVS